MSSRHGGRTTRKLPPAPPAAPVEVPPLLAAGVFELPPAPPAALASDGDIIPEGDFAGMRASDVLAAMTEDIHGVLGNASIETAGCALDMVLAEYLAVVRMAEGDAEAKAAGLRYIETALPYAALPVAVEQPYSAARQRLARKRS